ncbi:MAG TPA: ATP-binding protein [Chitinophagaceae bacterium]|jgi:signal transduction histidine kinase|nr:ATP-binding protein [Chitinophagaceae bacterium]
MHENINEVTLTLIISTALIVLLGIVIVFALLTQHKRRFLHKQQLAEIKSNYEKTLLQTELKILEETYKSISQNLHDNVGSNISTTMLLLYKDEKMISEEIETNRKEALRMLSIIVDDLKNIARSLNPDYLYELGLCDAIRQRSDQLEKTKRYEVELYIKDSPKKLDRQKQVILFSIFQECLNNIQKHANAKKIIVRINYEENLLLLEIKDDGKGFDRSEAGKKVLDKGSGLLNMKHHSEMIGATFSIESEINSGTKINITLPEPYI